MKKKNIFLIILTVIIVVGAVYFLNKPLSCKNLYSEIENDLSKSNYCQVDSDCKVIMLGGEYIDFGCYHFVNKEIDQNNILSKMDTYKNKMGCSAMINDCDSAPNAKCIDNKCVFIESPKEKFCETDEDCQCLSGELIIPYCGCYNKEFVPPQTQDESPIFDCDAYCVDWPCICEDNICKDSYK